MHSPLRPCGCRDNYNPRDIFWAPHAGAFINNSANCQGCLKDCSPRPWSEHRTWFCRRLSRGVCAGVPVRLTFVAKVHPLLKLTVHINKLFVVQAKGKGKYEVIQHCCYHVDLFSSFIIGATGISTVIINTSKDDHINVLKSILCTTTMENICMRWNHGLRGGLM